MSIRTNVVDKILGKTYKIDSNTETTDKYFINISKDKERYILKGYKILWLHYGAVCKESISQIREILGKVSDIYQEYYSAKIGGIVSPHYVKPLMIDYAMLPAPDKYSNSYIIYETLFEYGGRDLAVLPSDGKFLMLYNWMRQSAVAIAILHNCGITHMDIKPQNIVYNPPPVDLIKIIDLGSSTSCATKTVNLKGIKYQGDIRESTQQYAPPELLQYDAGNSPNINNQIVDVYCWGMCFYALMLMKRQPSFDDEISKYKLNSEKEYKQFMINFVDQANALETNSEKEKKLKEFAKNTILKALKFSPKDRPSFTEIINDMINFEETELLDFQYKKTEQINKDRIMEKLLLHTKMDEIKELKEQEEKKKKDQLLKETNEAMEQMKKKYMDAVIKLREVYIKKTNQLKEMQIEIEKLNKIINEKQILNQRVLSHASSVQSNNENGMSVYHEDDLYDMADQSDRIPEEDVKNSPQLVYNPLKTSKSIDLGNKCDKCRKGIERKAQLECTHSICLACIRKYVMNQFLMRHPYNQTVCCSICNKNAKISKIYTPKCLVSIFFTGCPCVQNDFSQPITNSIYFDSMP